MREHKGPWVGLPPDEAKTLVLTLALQYKSKVGRWPTKQTGHSSTLDGAAWSGADTYLKRNCDSSLGALLGGRRPNFAWPKTLDKLRRLAEVHGTKFKEDSGHWPGLKSGVITTLTGQPCWKSLDAKLHCLGSSLALVFGKSRRTRRCAYRWPSDASDFSALALEHGLLFKSLHKRWPSDRSGAITTLPKAPTWGSLFAAAKSRGVSMLRVFEKSLAPWAGLSLPDLQEFAREAAAQWAAGSGKRPNTATPGPIDCLGGRTWGALSGALRALGGSLADALGDQVLIDAQAVADFQAKTGQPPMVRVGCDAYELKLARTRQSLLRHHPHTCAQFGITPQLDRGLALKRSWETRRNSQPTAPAKGKGKQASAKG